MVRTSEFCRLRIAGRRCSGAPLTDCGMMLSEASAMLHWRVSASADTDEELEAHAGVVGEVAVGGCCITVLES